MDAATASIDGVEAVPGLWAAGDNAGSTMLERIFENSRSTYAWFDQWEQIRSDNREVQQQFEIVRAQGKAFNDAMVSSVKVSTCGKGLADEAIFLCVKIRTDNQFDRMPILEEMVKKAKKGGELAHGILHSFERIQDRLLEVSAAVPHIAKQIETELAASSQKLDKIRRKLNNGGSGFLSIGSFFTRRAKEKAEVSHNSLASDHAKFSQLEGLEKIIGDVTHLVNWWDENTLRLEKLYGDGLAARNTNQIHDYVSERMEYEWTIISKEFMGYTSKVKFLDRSSAATQTQYKRLASK